MSVTKYWCQNFGDIWLLNHHFLIQIFIFGPKWIIFGPEYIIFGPKCIIFGSECIICGPECIIYGSECIIFGPAYIILGSECIIFGSKCIKMHFIKLQKLFRPWSSNTMIFARIKSGFRSFSEIILAWTFHKPEVTKDQTFLSDG